MEEKQQMNSPKQRIFISYRRKGGIDTARWLHDQLKNRGYRVFIDLEGLRAGAFNKALYHEIKNSDVFLLVLSKDSLDRCRNANDWVRQELSYALRCGLKVIPIMKEDFTFPSRLPSDIDAVRSYQALRVSYDFFDAFMDKLEEYIEDDTVIPGDPGGLPEPDPAPVFWKSPVVIGAAAIVLLLGAFMIGRVKPDPSDEISLPPAQTAAPSETAAPVQTAPPTEAPTEAPTVPETEPPAPPASGQPGNTVTDLCDGGIVAEKNEGAVVWMNSQDVKWFNLFPETGTYYFYDIQQRFIAVDWKDGDKTLRVKLLKDVDCEYLYVTSEWLYCVLEKDGTETLYRAKNDLAEHAIGQLQPIVENVLSHNRIAILDDYVYYWIRTEGLFKCRTDGSDRQLLFNNGGSTNLFGLITFHASEDAVYFWASTGGIYSVQTKDGKLAKILDTRGRASVPTHAVEYDGTFYYVMDPAPDGGRTAPVEIWCVDMDGTDDRLLYTLESADMDVLHMNSAASTLYLRIAGSDGVALYSVDMDGDGFERLTDPS